MPKTYGIPAMYILGIGSTCKAYMQPPRSISAAILLALALFPLSTMFFNLSNSVLVDSSPIYHTQLSNIGSKPAVYTQILSIGPINEIDTQHSNTKPAHAVQTPLFAINPPAKITPISIDYSILADFHDKNKRFIFKLANAWKDALKSLSKNFQIGKTNK